MDSKNFIPREIMAKCEYDGESGASWFTLDGKEWQLSLSHFVPAEEQGVCDAPTYKEMIEWLLKKKVAIFRLGYSDDGYRYKIAIFVKHSDWQFVRYKKKPLSPIIFFATELQAIERALEELSK